MLTRKQYKFLKKVSKNDMACNDSHQNKDEIYSYLLRKRFIEEYSVNPDGDIMERNLVFYCRASEDGKVELKLCRQERYHFWIPTIISIIALIISDLTISSVPVLWTYVQETFVQSDTEDH